METPKHNASHEWPRPDRVYEQNDKVLEAVQDEDGVWRIPSLLVTNNDAAEDLVAEWKYMGGYASGLYVIGTGITYMSPV